VDYLLLQAQVTQNILFIHQNAKGHMVSDKIQKYSQRAELAKLTKLPHLQSSVTGRKDQDTRIKISAFLGHRLPMT